MGTSLDIMPSGILLTSNPAVDTEISLTTDYDYKINLIRIPLVTDSGVANRTVTLTITVDSSIIYSVPISAVITASTTAEILFGEGLPYTSVGDVRMIPLPHGLKIPRGAVIETVTDLMEAGDDYGAAVLFVDKLN